MGLRRTLDAGGLTAAPVLAGFSFTLLALILPDLRPDTPATVRDGLVAVAGDEPFSVSPEAAAILFIVAGALFVFALQAALMARQVGMTPSELMDWMTDEVRPPGKAPAETRHGIAERRLHDRDVTSSLRWTQREMARLEMPWLRATKWLYNAGMIALLAGIVVMVWPPDPGDATAQTAAALVALSALLFEVVLLATLRIAFLRAKRRAKSARA